MDARVVEGGRQPEGTVASTAQGSPGWFPAMSRWSEAVWSSPVGAGVAATLAYTLLAIVLRPSGLDQSRYPYFQYLAEAFLHGELGLVTSPPTTHDLSLYQGRLYLYWPPFPAVLFTPLVAAFGVGVSDAPLTLAAGGLNVALVAMLLRAMDRRGIAKLSPEKRAWLTAFFALGTVHITLAPFPRVWFTALVIGFGLSCGAYLAALWMPRSWGALLSGVLVGCGFLTRSVTLLAAIWVGWYLWRERDRVHRWSSLWTAGLWLAPIGLAVGIQGAYNLLRFGDPLETGLAYHQMSPLFQADYQRYGAFSLQYLPTNFFYNFVTIPYVALFGDSPEIEFWMGGSLFLMSPVFLLAIPGCLRSWRGHGIALAASCAAGVVPMLLLMGTGWMQFGPRYTLDITVPLLMATAIGAASARQTLLERLSMVSFLFYVPGAILMGIRLL